MKYLISESPLRLKEFGRNVQSMVEYALTIQDRRERTRFAEQIVKIMLQLYPGLKDTVEVKQYIWDSLFIISNFELDVDSPFPVPEPNVFLKNKKRVPYSNKHPVYAHFGKNVELALAQAAKMEEGPKRWELIMKVAAFMRQCLEELNKEAYIEESISNYIFELSNGQIRVNPKDLMHLQPSVVPQIPPQRIKSGKPLGGENRSRGGFENGGGRNRGGLKPLPKRRR